jgi:hypothetical protein
MMVIDAAALGRFRVYMEEESLSKGVFVRSIQKKQSLFPNIITQ